MNNKMFKRVARQANIKLDFSTTGPLIPGSIKFVFSDNLYRVYLIDNNCQSKLIVETEYERKAYDATVKYLGIKLNTFGDVKNKQHRR